MQFEPTLDEDLATTTVDALGGVGDGLGNLQLIDFKLPPPKEFSEEDRDVLIRESVTRIWSGAEELKFTDQDSGTDMWMLLVVRLVTRVVEPPVDEEEAQKKEEEEAPGGVVDLNFYSHQDRLRQTLCDYVVQDFQSRCVFSQWKISLYSLCFRVMLATTWMNEEWYNDQIRLRTNSDWVSATILCTLSSHLA